MGDTDDYLLMSGIQHFIFCPRQWALIHIEQQWSENYLTVEGQIIHERCHDETIREKRGDVLIARGLQVISHRLRLAGKCDVVEFHADSKGVPIFNEPGLYLPAPVEYKRGKSKLGDEDRAQVCAQAMALEETFCCDVSLGYVFYSEIRHREEVTIDEKLRQRVADAAAQMNEYFSKGYTPRPKKNKKCGRCSIADICEPRLEVVDDVADYIQRELGGVGL